MAASSRQQRFDHALAIMRDRVADPAADMLPSERELSASLGVSRTTVRRLLAQLADEGLVSQRQGVGTFVARPGGAPSRNARTTDDPGHRADKPSAPDTKPSPRLIDWAERLRRRGRHPVLRHESEATGWPSLLEAEELGVGPSEPIHRLTRLWDLDGHPLAVERVVRPTPDARSEAGAAPLSARTLLTIGRATPAVARDLGAEPGMAVAILRCVERTGGGRPCSCRTLTVAGDRFAVLWRSDGGEPDWDVPAG